MSDNGDARRSFLRSRPESRHEFVQFLPSPIGDLPSLISRLAKVRSLPLPWAPELCYISHMNAQDAIATLRRYENALRARGVAHAAVFGSVARGDNQPDSDLDILVEFEPGSEGTIYDYVRFKEYVAGLFEGPVDVIDRAALKPHLRAPAARDVVYAF